VIERSVNSKMLARIGFCQWWRHGLRCPVLSSIGFDGSAARLSLFCDAFSSAVIAALLDLVLDAFPQREAA
jgi:hypothetical protein